MPVFPGTEPSEIFRGLGTGILEELHFDPPRRSPSNGHIEEYHRVPSSDGLRIGRRRNRAGALSRLKNTNKKFLGHTTGQQVVGHIRRMEQGPWTAV